VNATTLAEIFANSKNQETQRSDWTMSTEIKDLIKTFEDWVTFAKRLQVLNEEVWNSSLEPGKWTFRDIISHIMLWDKYFYEEAIEKIANDKQITLKHLDFDEFNSNAITYGRTITTKELIRKTILYRKNIIDDISTLSEEAINRNHVDGEGNIFNVPQYMKDFIWHDQHHMNPLKEYIKAI
jgi:hypothetical protein